MMNLVLFSKEQTKPARRPCLRARPSAGRRSSGGDDWHDEEEESPEDDYHL